jgi:integrase/recombinase XerD
MAYQFRRQPLLAEEVIKLNNACDTFEEKLIIWTLLDTGLRIGELAALTKNNILWQEKAIRIDGKGGPYGKMTKKRLIPMSDRVLALMTNYFTQHNKWFLQKRQMQLKVRQIANKAQIISPVSPHVLRHTFACTAIQKGISLAALKKIMGHDSITTTEIYLNLNDPHLIDEFRNKW